MGCRHWNRHRHVARNLLISKSSTQMSSFKLEREPGRRPSRLTSLRPWELRKIVTGGGYSGYGDFLTSQQISSYSSRLAAKRSVEVDQPNSEDETAGEDPQNVLRDKGLSEVSIQYSHPIIYDSYNICELVINTKLSSLSVSMLRNIGEAFGLDT